MHRICKPFDILIQTVFDENASIHEKKEFYITKTALFQGRYNNFVLVYFDNL